MTVSATTGLVPTILLHCISAICTCSVQRVEFQSAVVSRLGILKLDSSKIGCTVNKLQALTFIAVKKVKFGIYSITQPELVHRLRNGAISGMYKYEGILIVK